ncbi:hypothetical protein Fleli_3482 [Bernardetia litoralis DSM 6794]|uniref:Uncharacterized protein n=1 Tax=Bernardetia litoralis (strain ATCC 23117 / DSM 6794 / NBRC 15988 / NCIMB 1366 / Fx l1 / Sio-4) TaxID=880071 RepID=I4APB7_BERLS|nr:hypothetical protein [Bernardetia litoralis]AFM05802.1 hypothetical protein Fleli_3482 [Bernardetia litoralis DSM 6794]
MSEIRIKVVNIFNLSDGRTIFSGKLNDKDSIQKGNWMLTKDKKVIKKIYINNENIFAKSREEGLITLETFTFIDKSILDLGVDIELVRFPQLDLE